MISKLTKFVSKSSPPASISATERPQETLATKQQTEPNRVAVSPSAQAPRSANKRHSSPRRNHPRPVDSSPELSEQVFFGQWPVSAAIGRALQEMGYAEPTAIQDEVIPLVRAGQDLVGQAQTGTGKTAAFGIPLVENINRQGREPQVLVLVPTRELAVQVKGELARLGQFCGVRVVAIYGGQAMSIQLAALRRDVHIIVATPGRLIDHMQRGTINIRQVRSVVLDEADQMLDIGFAQDIDYILRQTPQSRETLLFSATIPGPISTLARRYLKDPAWIRVGGDGEPVEQVKQHYYEVADLDRPDALDELLQQPGVITQALVFRRTKVGVDRLVSYIQGRGHDAQAIHGDMTQAHRDRVMSCFRSGSLRVLVATNVAARGLDIPDVSHVINYDIPDNVDEYIHRIGRTARMGRTGTAITFVSEWDFEVLDMIQSHVGDNLELATLAVSNK